MNEKIFFHVEVLDAFSIKLKKKLCNCTLYIYIYLSLTHETYETELLCSLITSAKSEVFLPDGLPMT